MTQLAILAMIEKWVGDSATWLNCKPGQQGSIWKWTTENDYPDNPPGFANATKINCFELVILAAIQKATMKTTKPELVIDLIEGISKPLDYEKLQEFYEKISQIKKKSPPRIQMTYASLWQKFMSGNEDYKQLPKFTDVTNANAELSKGDLLFFMGTNHVAVYDGGKILPPFITGKIKDLKKPPASPSKTKLLKAYQNYTYEWPSVLSFWGTTVDEPAKVERVSVLDLINRAIEDAGTIIELGADIAKINEALQKLSINYARIQWGAVNPSNN